MLIHINGLFDIIDLYSKRKIRTFSLGENIEVIKCRFLESKKKVFCVIKNHTNKSQSLLVFNYSTGAELGVEEMNLVDDFRDFDVY